LKEWLASVLQGMPYAQAFVHGAIIITFIQVSVLLLIYMERKVAGFIQSRVGPLRTGPYGSLQTLADAIKLMAKEDIVPAAADRFLFLLAPFIVLLPTFLVFSVLPFAESWLVQEFSAALIFIVGASTMAITGIIMAGWGTNNKYSLLGGMRSAAQLISYEIPIVLALLCVTFYAGSMNTVEIVAAQAGVRYLFGIPLPNWFILHPPLMLAALIYYIGQLAETNRTPFDLPEAESELVSGFHTEYSGMRFAFFFLAEFANTFFAAGLGIVLFFGGWDGLGGNWGALWFLTKSYVGVFFLMWIRWTLPRVRIDQLLGFAWKVLVPMGLIAVLWTAAAVVFGGTAR